MNLKTLLSATAILAASPSAFALANETPADTARHILNFEDVELSALIADVSTVTGYTFVVHPEARTKRITVSSTTPLTRQQVFDVFLSCACTDLRRSRPVRPHIALSRNKVLWVRRA